MSLRYPLQIDTFSLLDKAKVASFILQGNRLTQGEKVKEYEKIWEKDTGAKYAVFVNSGSSANFLVAQRLKDKLISSGEWSFRKTVIFPSLTWTTSITPFLMLGFKPHFIDIDINNWGMNYDSTKRYVNYHIGEVAAIFPTALLGMNFDHRFFNSKFKDKGVRFLFDGCEASFNRLVNERGDSDSILKHTTSTTSTFFAHYANSIEGGVIFCDNKEDYAWYLMARNHGLTRSLYPYAWELGNEFIKQYQNPLVNKQFDFNIEGSNFRNTDINAMFGILDSKKWCGMIWDRKRLSEVWAEELNSDKFILPKNFIDDGIVPFALPIVVRDKEKISKIQSLLIEMGIESRPIISGSLRYQTIYKKYMKGKKYPVADLLHYNGLYIGLHSKLKKTFLIDLARKLNNL